MYLLVHDKLISYVEVALSLRFYICRPRVRSNCIGSRRLTQVPGEQQYYQGYLNYRSKCSLRQNNPGVLNAPLAGTSDETALGRCASKGNYGMCRLLLKLGANPDIMSGNRTPLMVASLVNNIQIVELLLESKANPLIYTKDRLNALDFAIMAGNYSIALLFTKSKNMKPTYKPKEYLANANVSEIGYYVNY